VSSKSTNYDSSERFMIKLEESNAELKSKLHKFTDVDNYKLFQLKIGRESDIKFWRVYYLTKIDYIDLC